MAEENTRDLDHLTPQKMRRADEVIASIPREALKAMFYMFAGKPDSIVKIFDRRIVIKIEDIEELNLRIKEKLENHRIEGVLTSVDIGYGQVLFLVEIMEAVGFNQQQSRLASLYLSSSSCAERA